MGESRLKMMCHSPTLDVWMVTYLMRVNSSSDILVEAVYSSLSQDHSFHLPEWHYTFCHFIPKSLFEVNTFCTCLQIPLLLKWLPHSLPIQAPASFEGFWIPGFHSNLYADITLKQKMSVGNLFMPFPSKDPWPSSDLITVSLLFFKSTFYIIF